MNHNESKIPKPKPRKKANEFCEIDKKRDENKTLKIKRTDDIKNAFNEKYEAKDIARSMSEKEMIKEEFINNDVQVEINPGFSIDEIDKFIMVLEKETNYVDMESSVLSNGCLKLNFKKIEHKEAFLKKSPIRWNDYTLTISNETRIFGNQYEITGDNNSEKTCYASQQECRHLRTGSQTRSKIDHSTKQTKCKQPKPAKYSDELLSASQCNLNKSNDNSDNYDNDVDKGIHDNEDENDEFEYNSSDNESINSEQSQHSKMNNIMSKMKFITNGKPLKLWIDKRVKELKQKYGNVSIDIIDSKKKGKIDLQVIIMTTDQDNFENVKSEIFKWKVWTRKMKLNKNEMNQIWKSRQHFYRLINNKEKEMEVKINNNNNEIVVFTLDKNKTNNIYDKIMRFRDNEVKISKKIEIANQEDFYFIYKLYEKDKREFEKKFNLNKIEIVFMKPVIEKSLSGKIILSGIKKYLDKAIVDDLFKVYEKEFTVNIKNRNSLSYVRSKCNLTRGEMEEKSIRMEFDNDLKKLKFLYLRENEDDVIDKIKQLQSLAEDATTLTINVDDNNLKKASEIVLDLKKHKKSAYENEIQEVQQESDIQIYLKEDSKIIYINGIDKREVTDIKEYLEEKIKGSMKLTKIIKVRSELIYNSITNEHKSLFNKIKDHQKINILSKYNKDRIIRLIGEKESIDSAEKEINELINKISKDLETNIIEMKSSEYEYLFKQKIDLKNLEKKARISKTAFVSYAVAELNDHVNLKLFLGDCVDLHVDAYVSPVNVGMKSNGGLAAAIVNASGSDVKSECEKYIRNYGKLNEGSVFVTGSGNLGTKESCIVIHAAGPVWRGGEYNETKNLKNVVEQCLIEATKRNCTSIAIPAISSGIFQYDYVEATKIITTTVVNFMKDSRASLKEIIFIENETSKIEKWEKIMMSVCYCKGINKVTSFSCAVFCNWYWKDDQLKWKAYAENLNNYIQEKYEKNDLVFDLTINNKQYKIFLKKPNQYNSKSFVQVNMKTGYVHEITNEMPNVETFRWLWLDDYRNKSPYSIYHSNEIETAYQCGKPSVTMEIKRHADDKDCDYVIVFNRRYQGATQIVSQTDQDAAALQINVKTKYARLVFRENIITKATIDNSDLADFEDIKRSKIIFISSFYDRIQECVELIKEIINYGKREESFPKFDLDQDDLKRFKESFDVEIRSNENNLILSGMSNNVDRVKSELLNLSIRAGNKLKYPEHWSHMKPSDRLKLIKLESKSSEYKIIFDKVKQTVSSFDIEKIERIQNKHLWKIYQRQLDFFKDKGVQSNEVLLFHGTRSTSPDNIYDGEIGFQMQFSGQGMWGRGIYFAVNAVYSKQNYAYKNNDGTHSLFYARVALGDFVQLPASNSITLPPEKPQSNGQFSKIRYDSIKGNTGGSDVFIIYENGRAYPEYLITFKV